MDGSRLAYAIHFCTAYKHTRMMHQEATCSAVVRFERVISRMPVLLRRGSIDEAPPSFPSMHAAAEANQISIAAPTAPGTHRAEAETGWGA